MPRKIAGANLSPSVNLKKGRLDLKCIHNFRFFGTIAIEFRLDSFHVVGCSPEHPGLETCRETQLRFATECFGVAFQFAKFLKKELPVCIV